MIMVLQVSKRTEKWGSIDSKGTIVQEPTYDLDSYLLVNFYRQMAFR